MGRKNSVGNATGTAITKHFLLQGTPGFFTMSQLSNILLKTLSLCAKPGILSLLIYNLQVQIHNTRLIVIFAF
jgi:hypothetical protein